MEQGCPVLRELLVGRSVHVKTALGTHTTAEQWWEVLCPIVSSCGVCFLYLLHF